MPTYEYLCKSCGERFEKFQSFSAKPLKTHDACGGEVQKVFHASGVVFKGSGFYATDNRVASRSSTESATDGGAKDSGTKDSSSKDSGKDSGSKDSGSKDSGTKETSTGSKPSKNGSKSSSASARATAAD